MRILLVSNNYTPFSGGVVSSLNALIPELQKAGHEVLLVAPQFLASHPDDPVWVQRLFTLIRFSYRDNRMAVPWRTRHQLTTIIDTFKPDVVHVQHPFLLGETARSLSRKKQIPIVFTYHTMYEDYAHYVPLPRAFVRWIILRLVNRFCQSVDAIIVGSNAVAKLLRERGVTTPIHVIPSPLQPDFIVDEAQALRHVPSNRWTLLTVGRMVPEKNMRATLDLYALLPRDRFQLVLVGFGSDYQALQNYAFKHLALSHDDVQFVHKPPRSDIAAWYRKADLFVFTSQTDTQGLVLAESMAAGMPAVALHGPGQDESVVDGINGFLCDTITCMRDKILWLQENQEVYVAMRKKAYESSLAYHPEVVVNKIVEGYEQAFTMQAKDER